MSDGFSTFDKKKKEPYHSVWEEYTYQHAAPPTKSLIVMQEEPCVLFPISLLMDIYAETQSTVLREKILKVVKGEK